MINSFGGTSFRLKLHEAQDRVVEFNQATAKLAGQAADEYTESSGTPIVVAGLIGPAGGLFDPKGALTHSSSVAALRE